MKKLQTSLAVGVGALMAFGFALPAFAQNLTTAVSTNVNANVTVAGTSVTASSSVKASANLATWISNAKTRADEEIQRRMTALNAVNTAVAAMVHVDATEKADISALVSTQISALTTLQATIAADTTKTALQTDIRSITQGYRIYMLVIPQARIAVASDKIQDVGGLMTTFAGKLQTRITAAQQAGQNVSTLTSELADLNTQVTNADASAQTAVSETASLQPDNGNATVEASNTAALKDARTKIQAALSDLKTARIDAGNIVKALAAMHLSASATATTSTQ